MMEAVIGTATLVAWVPAPDALVQRYVIRVFADAPVSDVV